MEGVYGDPLPEFSDVIDLWLQKCPEFKEDENEPSEKVCHAIQGIGTIDRSQGLPGKDDELLDNSLNILENCLIQRFENFGKEVFDSVYLLFLQFQCGFHKMMKTKSVIGARWRKHGPFMWINSEGIDVWIQPLSRMRLNWIQRKWLPSTTRWIQKITSDKTPRTGWKMEYTQQVLFKPP